MLAFGAAALLKLVVEELFVEAHEGRESVWTRSCPRFIVFAAFAALAE
ncbi:hypothetical protein [Nostocoides vanveenii]